jgi:ankyrin repeat protein
VAAVREDDVPSLRSQLDTAWPLLVKFAKFPSRVHFPILLLDLALARNSAQCLIHLFNERTKPAREVACPEEEDFADPAAFPLEEEEEEEASAEPISEIDAVDETVQSVLAELTIPDSVLGWLRETPFGEQALTGFDAFYIAANHERPDLMVRFIEHGCDATQISRYGTTVYNGLILKHNIPLIELFIALEVPVSAAANGHWPLHSAVKRHDGELIEVLLDGTDSDVDCTDRYGNTPLHFAARFGLPGICSLLTDYGADVDRRNRMGFTPLHFAALYGHLGVVQALADAGADLGALDAQDRTPLNLAALKKRKPCMRWFEEMGYTNDNMVKMPVPKKRGKGSKMEGGKQLSAKAARELVRKLR